MGPVATAWGVLLFTLAALDRQRRKSARRRKRPAAAAAYAVVAWMFLVPGIGAPVAFAQSSDSSGTEPDWTIAVIKLHYARAEELAPVLEAVLPPTVTITPYPPTNSLIISGDPAVISRLREVDQEVSETPPE